MAPSRILIVGGGGREHALAWRLAADDHHPDVAIAPGNAGLARAHRCLPARETDAAAVLAAARDFAADLVVIGPETALAAGVADALAAEGSAVFGPSREAARLESSKWFAKEVMRDAGVPTARAEVFGAAAAARGALPRFGPPWVVKADGLAAGKGVRVTADRAEAERFVDECLEGGRFGESGRTVVLEEFLEGEEASVMAVCDGERFVLLPPARDYKRAGDGDTGPNTGGMGSFAPTPAIGPGEEREVGERVVAPVLRAMARRGAPFRGALYCGLMLGRAGLRVVEFNARFGDPETQSILPLVAGSFTALLAGAAAGGLDPAAVSRRPGAAVTVALVDERYPGGSGGDGVITGLEIAEGAPGVRVFHAGTEAGADGAWNVRGGRAAYVTACAGDRDAARALAYAAIEGLGGGGWRCRRDIAASGAVAPVGGG